MITCVTFYLKPIWKSSVVLVNNTGNLNNKLHHKRFLQKNVSYWLKLLFYCIININNMWEFWYISSVTFLWCDFVEWNIGLVEKECIWVWTVTSKASISNRFSLKRSKFIYYGSKEYTCLIFDKFSKSIFDSIFFVEMLEEVVVNEKLGEYNGWGKICTLNPLPFVSLL